MKLACALLLLPILAACGGAPTQAQKEIHRAAAAADGVQRVRVVGGSYFFKPNHIVVKVDTPVELEASREPGMTPHDLVIQDPDGRVIVEQDLATEPKKIALTPKRTGLYHFYCSMKLPLTPGHRARGMEGVLEVVP